MPQNSQAPPEVEDTALRLDQPKAMRRGSLSERYVKCSKPGCACGKDAKARHGPYYSLTRGVGGSTRSRFLSAAQAVRARAQIATGHEFREQVEEYWEACERRADQELEAVQAGCEEPAKKRASKQSSTGRSPRKSKG